MGSLSLKYGSQGALSLSLWFLLLQLSVLVHELLAVEVCPNESEKVPYDHNFILLMQTI